MTVRRANVDSSVSPPPSTTNPPRLHQLAFIHMCADDESAALVPAMALSRRDKDNPCKMLEYFEYTIPRNHKANIQHYEHAVDRLNAYVEGYQDALGKYKALMVKFAVVETESDMSSAEEEGRLG